MTSRAYRKCQQILKRLIIKCGPTARVGKGAVEKQIEEIVGINQRTKNDYVKAMLDFEMLIPYSKEVYRLNWSKLAKEDMTQLTLQDFQTKLEVNVEEKP